MNRWDFLKVNLDKYIQNSLISEIIVLDETGSDTSAIRQRYPSVYAYTNARRIGAFKNKRAVVKMATSEWVALIDSDNFAPQEYFSAFLQAVAKHPDVNVFAPIGTLPTAGHQGFDYSEFEGEISIENYKSLFRRNQGIFNTGNYIVRRQHFLRPEFDGDPRLIDKVTALDVMYQNYLLFQNQNTVMYVTPGMKYFHTVHDGSYYINSVKDHSTFDSLYRADASTRRKPLLIEVGAFDGSDTLLYHSKGYRIFAFEPKRDLYSELVRKTTGVEGITVIDRAVCLLNGVVHFNVCRRGGASSILRFKDNETLDEHWGPDRDDIRYSGETYDVQATRLDTFIEEYGLQSEIIDFIHIDAQGVDIDVLKSLGRYLENLKAGVMEVASSTESAIYVSQTDNTLDNATVWLVQNGFQIDSVKSNDRRDCELNIRFSRRPIDRPYDHP